MISLQTRFWALAFLLLFSRARVELDGERHVLPWGHVRVPVVAGRHVLRVSVRYFWWDIGAATKEFDVRGGHIVELDYRAPWLVLLPGKLRLRGDNRPLLAQEIPSGLAGSAPPLAATPGWYSDPSDGHQRRWWDGERWTPAIFRPQSRARYAWVVTLAVVVLGWVIGGAIVRSLQGDPDSSAGLAESAEWVTVTEIDGVRFELPRQPQHTTEPIAGTDLTFDLYTVDFGDIAMAAGGIAAEVPGDTRTDAEILRDSANGSAANVEGTIVSSRPTVVDGEPALDIEITTPRDGGWTTFGRVALADNLLVIVQTTFDHESDRDVAAAAHDRMSRSITFEG